MRRPFFAVLLSVLTVLTGTLNTLCAKWADTTKSEGKLFNHPFLQSLCMFLGELLCLGVYFLLHAYQRFRSTDDPSQREALKLVSPTVFFVPALCDIIATCLLYMGLVLTTASSYQMLRGSVIIFTALGARLFLRSKLTGYHWHGASLVFAGLLVIGLVDAWAEHGDEQQANHALIGNLLIIAAQFFEAIQMVYEEKYLAEYEVPALLAVGLEGIWGVIVMSTICTAFYPIQVPEPWSTNPDGHLEDISFAFRQIASQPAIGLALVLTIVSVAAFNWAGVSVTKELSSTTRVVLDSVRTLSVWALSIPLFGEQFAALQLLGCFLLIVGMFVYSDVIFGPFWRRSVQPKLADGPLATCCLALWSRPDDDDDEEEEVAPEERRLVSTATMENTEP